MQNTKYIEVLATGEYKELTEVEFSGAKENKTPRSIFVKDGNVLADNPGANRKLDAFTPHVSARRFLKDMFPALSYDASCSLAVFLTKQHGTLVILQ